MNHQQVLEQYHEQGFFTVENLFSPDLVEAVHHEITRIVDRYPDVPKELVQIEPVVTRGEYTPASVELGVRKLFRMAKHNEFFCHLAFHPKMVEIATTLLGPDVKLLQSMLLMKPPYCGGIKVWHQDNAYFRLTPNHVFGFWVACDEATVENGCMHVVPGSHKRGIAEHGGVNDDYGMMNPPPFAEAVPIPLKPGDALVFYTDGVTEAQNRAGEFFEETRLRDVIAAHALAPATEIADALDRALRDFQGDAEQADDVACIVMKRTR